MILVRKCYKDIDIYVKDDVPPGEPLHVTLTDLRTFFAEVKAGKWDHLIETPGAGGPH